MAEPKNSYGRILRSSSIIGGSQGITTLIGIVQTKCVAIFLGPMGVGLMGTYNSVLNLTSRLSGLGVVGSAVRQIAEARASGDQERLARTVTTLRLFCWFTGVGGAVFLAVLARPLSRWTFGSDAHWWALAILGVVILMRSLQAGQMAYIQGMRRIGDLARLKIVGALAGVTVGIALYAWLGIQGIVPALVALTAINLAASCYFARKAGTPKARVTRREFAGESRKLVQLGIVLMWSGLLAAVVAYLTRVMIIRTIDLDAAGIYQSAYRISGMFVGFILGAMGADFYPRLAGVADDNVTVNRLVNEQTEIGLLLAVPGLLATLTFAPWVIMILYTAKFAMATELLKWFVLGCLGRVISWPMGIILVAKGRKGWLFGVETAIHVLHVGLIWWGLAVLGILGVAVAFAVLYVVHIFMLVIVSWHVSGFCWSSGVLKILAVFIPLALVVFVATQYLDDLVVLAGGGVLTAGSGAYSVSQLAARLGPNHRVCRMLKKIPLVSRLVTRP